MSTCIALMSVEGWGSTQPYRVSRLLAMGSGHKGRIWRSFDLSLLLVGLRATMRETQPRRCCCRTHRKRLTAVGIAVARRKASD